MSRQQQHHSEKMSLVKSKGKGGWIPPMGPMAYGGQMMPAQQQQQFVSVEQLLNDVPVASLINPHVNRLVRMMALWNEAKSVRSQRASAINEKHLLIKLCLCACVAIDTRKS